MDLFDGHLRIRLESIGESGDLEFEDPVLVSIVPRFEYDLTGGASRAASQPERPAEGMCEMIPDPSMRR